MQPNSTQQGQVAPYSTPNSQTAIGSQVDQSNAAWSSMANGQPLPPQQLQQTTQGMAAATQQLANSQTPQVRQNYVNNGDIPAIQGNYDQLARQLYDIDKGIAGSGQYNMTPPPDAISSPGVAASPLALTNSILQGNTFSNPNPSFGMNTRMTQNNDIISLLNTLNSSLGNELNSRKNTYASTVKGQQSVVDAFQHILDQNSALGENQYNQQQENYRAGLSVRASNQSKAENFAKSLQDDLASHQKDWGSAWQALKQYSDSVNAGLNPQDIDNLLGGHFDPSDPDGSKGKTTGWAQSGAFQNRMIQTNQLKAMTSPDFINQVQQFKGAGSLVNQLQDAYESNIFKGPILGGIGELGAFSGLDSSAAHYNNLRDGFLAIISKATGEKGVLTDQDADRAKSLVGGLGKNPTTSAADFNSLRRIFNESISRKTGQPIQLIGPDGTIYQYPSPDDPDYKTRVGQGGVMQPN